MLGLIPLFCLFFLSSCVGLPGTHADDLDITAQTYLKALRWGSYEAVVAFHRPNKVHLDADYFSQFKIVSAELLQPLMPEEGRAPQMIEIAYMRMDQQRIRSLRIQQTWGYDSTRKVWLLDDDLPPLR